MKNKAALLMALGLALPAMTFAQDADQSRPPRRQRLGVQGNGTGDQPNRPPFNPNVEGPRPVPPLMAALDTNHDGMIDEDEIKNAPEALRKLDKNGDGKLTLDELRPPRPDRDNDPASDDARPARRGPRPHADR